MGKAIKKRLDSLGIRTIGGLANTSLRTLQSNFGKWGEILHCFSNGLDISPVAKFDNAPTVKSIGNSTTAPRDLLNEEDIKITLYVLADSVCRRLREQGFKGRVVSINVRDNELLSFTRQHYRWQNPVRSFGISISDLVSDTAAIQTSLFHDEAARERKENLDRTTDWLKGRFGSYCVQPAIFLADKALSGFDPKNTHTIHPVGYF